jgi:hypothetical protein
MMQSDETSDNHTSDDTTEPTSSKQGRKLSWRRSLLISLSIVVVAVLISGGYFGYLYASTPLNIRQPLFEHYHFRLSLNVDGKQVDFASAAFQEGYSKDNCNALLTTHPIHMHDSKNNFVHIHWEGITGGQVLKYYGWNFISGPDNSLGYRFDQLPEVQSVPIHGNVLPARPAGSQYYVYTGNADTYKQRSFEDFTSQDLEKFFNKTSNSPAHQLNQQKRSALLDKLVPKASAEGESQEQLTQINNLIGDVVIFVQKDQPSASQIRDRFDHLAPLSTSTCGG